MGLGALPRHLKTVRSQLLVGDYGYLPFHKPGDSWADEWYDVF